MHKRILDKDTGANQPYNPDFLKNIYHQWCHEKRIKFDNLQLITITELQNTLDNLIRLQLYYQKPAWRRMSNPLPKNPSLYIYGDVGRGKSMLMNLFYEACPIKMKARFHYSKFISQIHAYLHVSSQHKKTETLATFANKLSSEIKLLCIDEFYVTDIADAMILERLFSQLIKLNITIVITSNRHPNDLYQGGIQKAQFSKFTELLQGHVKIIALDTPTDYRLSYLRSTQPVYFFPLGKASDQFINNAYAQLTQNAAIIPYQFSLLGRTTTIRSAYQNIALTSFNELCEQPLGSNDYCEMAQQFNYLIMANIPKMSYEYRNEAKRFMSLIDALYEHNVKLICSAETPAEDLYLEGDGSFEFKRTISRLIEMQTQHYLT